MQNNPVEPVANPAAARERALSLANQARRQSGVPALRMSAALNAAAQAHAEDMARRGFYNHRSPERQDVADRYRAAGGGLWAAIGENIASCISCTAGMGQVDAFQAQWIRSSGHRRNILDPRFSEFGFGMAAGGGRVYAVQTFISRR
ncbi:CAP domain-containing protein [Chelativorans sp.]|uniref:CAP domain-containing protein n=1 Tax=Chelativorans sp. TaxID=2203393 RepID=UPI002810EB01|nr:CAP domain-containing protein [Chelativorans sp.]